MKTNVWLSLFFMVLHAMPITSGNSGSAPVSPGYFGAAASSPGNNCVATRPVGRPADGDDDDIPSLPGGATFDVVAGICPDGDGTVPLLSQDVVDEVAGLRPSGKKITGALKDDGDGVRPAARVQRVSFADVVAQVSGLRLGIVVRPGGASACAESADAPRGLKRTKPLATNPRRMSCGGLNLSDMTAVSDSDSDWSAGEAPPQTAREDLADGTAAQLTFQHFYEAWVDARNRIEKLTKRLGYFITQYESMSDSGKMAQFLVACNELLTEEFERLGSSCVLDFSTSENLLDQYRKARNLYGQVLVKASSLRMGGICSHITGLDVFEPKPVALIDSSRIDYLMAPTCFDCPMNQGRKISSGVFNPATGLVSKCAWCDDFFLERFFNKVSQERLRECLTMLIKNIELAERYLQTITPGFVEA